jgi:allophanate hydrolase
MVGFSLGTDTAGSGRVPAGFNNIVGWKPTPGRVSTEGVVPACSRSIASRCSRCPAPMRARSRNAPVACTIGWAERFKFGVPRQLEFFGDSEYAALYRQAIETLKDDGRHGRAVRLRAVQGGRAAALCRPWVAERTAAVGDFIERPARRAAVWPVTRDIILGGRKYSAVDAFNGQYELAR